MASDGSDQDARYTLSKLLQRGTVAEYEKDFFKACITDARFEIIAKEDKEHIVEKKIDVILPLPLQGEFASSDELTHAKSGATIRYNPKPGRTIGAFIKEKIDIVISWPSEEAPPVIKGSLDANEDIGVIEVSSAIDDVFDIGENNVESMEVRTCGVGEDELNRVISALKDGGGEFDGRLDEINLNLSEELADNGVSPIPTSLVAHESSRARQLWERIGIGDAHGLMDNGRNHKFVQPNVWGWMSDSQSAYSSYHLEDKVIFEGVGSVTPLVG
ncbi:hypothetical protein Tco_1423048 [Tanacetum coccineum]